VKRAGHLKDMVNITHAYGTCQQTSSEEKNLGDPGVNGTIILKGILIKMNLRWIGYIWLG
jgi:hypothetical protein